MTKNQAQIFTDLNDLNKIVCHYFNIVLCKMSKKKFYKAYVKFDPSDVHLKFKRSKFYAYCGLNKN